MLQHYPACIATMWGAHREALRLPLRTSGVRVATRTQRMTDIPQDAQAPEDKAHGKANTRTHGSTHPTL